MFSYLDRHGLDELVQVGQRLLQLFASLEVAPFAMDLAAVVVKAVPHQNKRAQQGAQPVKVTARHQDLGRVEPVQEDLLRALV